jgi:hypothetical protein
MNEVKPTPVSSNYKHVSRFFIKEPAEKSGCCKNSS